MSKSSVNPRNVTIIRWIARIWSILIFYLVLTQITGLGWPLVGSWIMAVLGLLIAWRWEGMGGAIAIASTLAPLVGPCMIRGEGWVNTGLIFSFCEVGFVYLFVIGSPGLLFLVCWALSRGKRA